MENDNHKRENLYSPKDIVDNFGKQLSYDQVANLLPHFSEYEQQEIRQAMYEKQSIFWNSPEVVDYYSKFDWQGCLD